MKGIKLLIILMLAGVTVFAQGKTDKKAEKKARKEAKMAEDRANAARLMALFESRRFVLEAERLYDKQNNMYVLSKNINFVAFEGDTSSIQLSFTGLVGWNGVGGLTVEGRVTKMEIKAKEGQATFTVNAAVQNRAGGLVTMLFRVQPSGRAMVTMNGNFGDILKFEGMIVPLDESMVYKGRPKY